MADIALLTVGNVAPIYPMDARIRTYQANVALTAGDVVYLLTTGKLAQSDASAAGTAKFTGIVLETVGAGGFTSVLEHGEIAGFNVAGLDPLDLLYLSDTLDKIADAAGTVGRIVGKVLLIPDGTEVFMVMADYLAV